MSPRQQKPAEFDAYADRYAELIRDPIRDAFAASSRFFFERKIQVIRKFFERAGIDSQTLSWLDVGCGQGDLLRSGKPYFKSAAGCDPSEGMLQSCADLDVRHQKSLDRLPFDDGIFDFITAVGVFHHIPPRDRASFTPEPLRLLKPGGIFCVIEHNPLNPATRIIVSRTPVDADAHLLKAGETRRLLVAAGAVIIERRYFLLFPERLYAYFARVEDAAWRLPIGGQYCVFARKVERAPGAGVKQCIESADPNI